MIAKLATDEGRLNKTLLYELQIDFQIVSRAQKKS